MTPTNSSKTAAVRGGRWRPINASTQPTVNSASVWPTPQARRRPARPSGCGGAPPAATPPPGGRAPARGACRAAPREAARCQRDHPGPLPPSVEKQRRHHPQRERIRRRVVDVLATVERRPLDRRRRGREARVRCRSVNPAGTGAPTPARWADGSPSRTAPSGTSPSSRFSTSNAMSNHR